MENDLHTKSMVTEGLILGSFNSSVRVLFFTCISYYVMANCQNYVTVTKTM